MKAVKGYTRTGSLAYTHHRCGRNHPISPVRAIQRSNYTWRSESLLESTIRCTHLAFIWFNPRNDGALVPEIDVRVMEAALEDGLSFLIHYHQGL